MGRKYARRLQNHQLSVLVGNDGPGAETRAQRVGLRALGGSWAEEGRLHIRASGVRKCLGPGPTACPLSLRFLNASVCRGYPVLTALFSVVSVCGGGGVKIMWL